MARTFWSDRPLGVKLSALVATGALSPAVFAVASSTTRAMSDAQAAIDEVARMATSLHSSVARFRY